MKSRYFKQCKFFLVTSSGESGQEKNFEKLPTKISIQNPDKKLFHSIMLLFFFVMEVVWLFVMVSSEAQ